MAQKANSHDNHQKKARQSGLPVSIHPDDAKDKVFTAILKALLKMGNKPSSPKELANIIVKHKYATLGGATPFATVSSRISQHFKRAAEHNPPRAPLLAKHVDQNHSRKINYSLATGDNPTAATQESTIATNNNTEEESNTNTVTAAAKESMITKEDPNRTNSKTRRNPSTSSIQHYQRRKLDIDNDTEEEEDDSDDSEDEEHIHFHPTKKHKTEHNTTTPISPSIHPIQNELRPSTIDGYVQPPTNTLSTGSDEESDGEHSDYHEEMLKGDEDLDILAARRLSRRQSKSVIQQKANKINSNSSHSNNNNNSNNNTSNDTIKETTKDTTTTKETPPLPSLTITKSPSVTTNTTTTTLVNTGTRKPSFSFSSGFPGDQELWTPFSFEHDFDNVFLHDASTAHHIPFNIATPESVSVSELDNYFSSTTTTSTSTSTGHTRTQRKSFSSAMLGPNDKSLLQKVLLASAARGVADKIDEEEEVEEVEDKKEAKKEEEDTKDIKAKEEEETLVIKEEKLKEKELTTATTIKSLSSSSLMDVDNGEDFVKFEDDEKKDVAPPLVNKKVPDILPAQPTPPSSQPAQSTPPPPQISAPAPAPSSSTNTPTLSAAEILKSMNIQNLNLSALHQMTSSINSLQQLSPTFDLAKTMAAYMQSLAKSANANASSSSNSPHAMDLKSILTRFPALEAFLKKDPPASSSTSTSSSTPAPAPPPQQQPAPPPLVSPSTDFVPNLINASTPTSSEPIVHTLTPTTPPMYITLIDHIAVCIVVLPKTEHTPEYRIMRRVDTGFINGTVLLTAGGIETESERSMILSFEMERVRMPKKKSELFGTWIPLRRAQELAVTCSIQHKLGHFLEDSIESYFPNPLPIQLLNSRKPTRDSRLTALALAALRSSTTSHNDTISKSNGGFIAPPISRQSSSSGSMGAAQLQELLLTHPHKALKSNGLNKPPPLLGRYDSSEEMNDQLPVLIDEKQLKKSSSVNNTITTTTKEESSDVDIVNSSDSSVGTSTSSSNEDDDEEESDNNNHLEDMLNRNSKQTLHIRPRDLLKKRRRNTQEEEVEEIIEEPKVSKVARKKSSNSNSGGKWSSSSNSSSSNGKSNNNTTTTVTTNAKKPSTIIIKKSVTNSNSNGGGKKNIKKSSTATEDIDNVVVEHKPTVESKVETSPPPATKATKAAVVEDEQQTTEEQVDDEDEDIDIGGSDFDDDLR